MIFRRFRSLALVASLSLLASIALQAQVRPPRVANRLTQPVNDNARVTLKGFMHPLAIAANDRGAAPASMPLDRIQIVLKRSPEQESALKELIQEQNTPGSANYHKWLTPEQFGQKFGPSDQDVATLEAWLQSKGFNIEKLNRGRQTLEVSGSAAQFQNAFHAQIHKYMVNGQTHFANASNPQIPAALAPVFGGFASLNDFPVKPKAQIRGKAIYNPKTGKATPQWTMGSSAGVNFVLSPADFAKQYDLTPLYNAGTNGEGQTVAIINESNINVAMVNAFRSTFGLPFNPPRVVLAGNDPGIDGINNPDGPNDASSEAYVDVEWAGAVAPNAKIDLVIAADTPLEQGLFLAAEHAVYNDLAPVISVSFGYCESGLGGTNAFINNLWEQAAAQGITVVVASGDSGSAGCDYASEEYATQGAAVSGYASTPYNVAVGGTDFFYSAFDQGSTAISNQIDGYWNTSPSNGSATASIKGYIPEQPWNDSQYGDNLFSFYDSLGYTTVGGGGGGPSTCGDPTVDSNGNVQSCAGYAKPSWQTGPGVPNDNVRDIPDVSLFAADGVNASFYPICADDADCQGAGSDGVIQVSGGGGTSFSAPAFAGIMALVNQKYGRQGQADNVLYPLATQFPAAFHDVTNGNNSVPCSLTSTDCIPVTNPLTDSSGSVTEGEIGSGTTAEYRAGAGYDLASGLGSVDAALLVNNWGNVTFASSNVTLTPSSTSFQHGTAISISGSVTGSTPTGSVALMTDSAEQGQQAQGSAAWLSGDQGVFTLKADGSFSAANVNYLPGGTYNIWGRYSGDGTNAASTSDKTQITVTAEPSTTYFNLYNLASTIASGTGNIAYGTQISLSAQPVATTYYNQCISPATPPSSCNSIYLAPATGTVSFSDNGTALTTAPLDPEGDAEYNGAWSVGAHSVTASYSGDNSYQPSTASALTFTVVKDTPQVSLTTDVETQQGDLVQGQSTVITIQVLNSANLTNESNYGINFASPVAAPTGTVSISGLPSGVPTSATLVAGVDPNTAAPAGIATITLPATLAAGNYSMSVTYNGDSNYTSASSSANFTLAGVGGTASSITASISGSISPTSLVTISGTVTGKSGSGAPSGTVLIYSSGYVVQQQVPMAAGSGVTATFSTTFSSQTLLQGGNTITVQYLGDKTYGPSAVTLTNPVSNPLADFTMTPASSSIALQAGTAATDKIQVASVNGFAGAIAFTCVPGGSVGLGCSIDPTATLTSGGSATITLNLDPGSDTLNGPLDVLVTGTDATGKYVHTLLVRTYVSGGTAETPEFSISAPSSITISPGATIGNTLGISVHPVYGFRGKVSLTATVEGVAGSGGSNSPPTFTFSPQVVDLSGGEPLISTMAISSTSSTSLNTYVIDVKGMDESGTQQNAMVNVTVSQATFALSASPSSLSLNAGATTGNTSTLTVTPSGGFTGSVSFSCAVTTQPSGANDPPTCSASAASVTGTGTATTTLTVRTTATTTGAAHNPLGRFFTAGGGVVVAGLLFFGIPARRKKWRSILMVLLFAGIAGLGIGCGSGGGSSGGGNGGGGGTTIPGTTAGAYVLTVTGTSGSVTATTTVNLTVK